MRPLRLGIAVAAALAFAGAAVLACSSFSDAETPADGSVSLPDGSLVDAPSDTADGGPTPATFRCEGVDAMLCADFEVPPLASEWTSALELQGRVEVAEAGAPGSPSHAARFITSVGTPANSTKFAVGALIKVLTYPPRGKIRFEADVQIERTPLANPTLFSILGLNAGPGGEPPGIAVYSSGTTGTLLARYADGGVGVGTRFTVPASGWYHLVLDVDLKTGLAQASANGGPAGVLTLDLGGATGVNSLVFSAGAAAGFSNEENRVLVDNVLVTAP